MPPLLAFGAYETVMMGGAIIGGYMTARAVSNVANSMQQNQSTTSGSSDGTSADGTSSAGDQHAAAGQGANSTSPQTPPGPPCQGCSNEERKKKVKFDKNQLQSKFKHAGDFGVEGNYNNANASAYQNALESNLNDPATVPQGTYGYSQGSTVWFNPNTNLAIITDANDNFLTGFKLDPNTPQFTNYMQNGVLR